jgi:hypothetical protein
LSPAGDRGAEPPPRPLLHIGLVVATSRPLTRSRIVRSHAKTLSTTHGKIDRFCPIALKTRQNTRHSPI